MALVVPAAGGRVHAQAPPAPQFPPVDRGDGWLTGFTARIGMATLSGDDPRFQWDFDVGGDLNLFEMGRGRVAFLFNYEAVLGEQLQKFDPIFNNYTIDVMGGLERGPIEWAVRFHHLSRHLGDRPKRDVIAWNALGPEIAWRSRHAPLDAQVRGWALWVVTAYTVDYDAELGADALLVRALGTRVALVGRASTQAFLIDADRSSRGTQLGGRVEAGVRLSGEAAAFELYAAVDRRPDADLRENTPVTWTLLGVRFLNK